MKLYSTYELLAVEKIGVYIEAFSRTHGVFEIFYDDLTENEIITHPLIATAELYTNEIRFEHQAELQANQNYVAMRPAFEYLIVLGFDECSLADFVDVAMLHANKNYDVALRIIQIAVKNESALVQYRAIHGMTRLYYGGYQKIIPFLRDFFIADLDVSIQDLAENLLGDILLRIRNLPEWMTAGAPVFTEPMRTDPFAIDKWLTDGAPVTVAVFDEV